LTDSADRPDQETAPMTSTTSDLYAAAGVDVHAGEDAVEAMKASVAAARRPESVGGIGGFAGLFDASALRGYRRPLLATSADGVGTKVAVASAMGVYDTVGLDLIGMLVDDLVVCGAEPLFVSDYIACGRVVPERIAAIVAGVARGCQLAGAALVGGETAEHADLLGADEFDLAGSTTGVVEADALLGPERVRAGDAVVAMGSSGLHANGFVLVRKLFLRDAGWRLDRQVPEFGRSLGEELLEPTRIYAADALALIADVDVHAMAHVTGGGLAANLARVIPAGVQARIDRGSWRPAPVFNVAAGLAGVPVTDLERTLNCGVGMLAVLPADQADAAVRLLTARDVPAWIAGEIEPGDEPSPDQPGLDQSDLGQPDLGQPRAVLTGTYSR
jgi:phosphoribosylformylglycinamidine cyclo-ligase